MNTRSAPHFRACLDNGNIVFFRIRQMTFRHIRRSPGCQARSGPEESWQIRSQLIDGRKAWTCKFCSETNVWTRWHCRLPSGLQAKHDQAFHAQSEEWYSGPSSSSGEEEWKCQEQEEIKRLRAQVELFLSPCCLLRKQQGDRKSPEEPGEPARKGGGALALQQLAFLQAEVSRVYGGQQYRQEPIAPERGEGAEEREAWEEEWDDERMANGWYENAAYGSALDPAEGSDDVGGSLGRGNPSTPRNGTRARDSSRSPRGEIQGKR